MSFLRKTLTGPSSALLFYVLLAAAMLLKYFPFGPVYYPYLDDYNAYGALYHLLRAGENPWTLYLQYGMHTSRPLAGLLDVWFIAPLWNHPAFVLLGMTALHFFTLPLAESVFKRCRLPWGRAASLVFGLYPLLAEGTYWINASSRIVTGFFFLMCSAFLLCLYFEQADTRKAGAVNAPRSYALLFGAITTAILSLGFYEQTVSVGFALFILIIWAYRHPLYISAPSRKTRPRLGWYLWPVMYVGIIGGYYALFLRAGRMASRSTLADKPLFTQMTDSLRQIALLLFKEQGYNTVSLVQMEVSRFIKHPAVYAAPLVLGLLLAVLLAWTLGGETSEKQPTRPVLMYSGGALLLLFLAAFGPFFILKTSYLSLRNLFFCVPPLAMLVQWLWNARPRAFKKSGFFLAGAVCWGCLLLNAGAVNAFHIHYEADQAVAKQVLDTLHDQRTPGDYRKVWLFGVRYQYEPHGGVNLESSTLSDWALTGMVNVLATEAYGERYTAADGGYYMNPVMAGWGYTGNIDPARDLLLAVGADTHVILLTLDGDRLIASETGVTYGYIERDGEAFVFRKEV